MLSAFGSAAFVVLIFAIFYFFRYTGSGRIFLDRLGRPGEYDDEQALAREEAEALEQMDDIQRLEYMRAKGTSCWPEVWSCHCMLTTPFLSAFIEANPPETMQTDISLSQFLAIQEKGVSAWEFEPELEIANCFVEARTEIEFFDSECSVQSNLPIPKQNEVYYWEAKIYDKPESSLISIGLTTKPYPLFRLPGIHLSHSSNEKYPTNTSDLGWHKSSISYTSPGTRRHNQPFTPTPYGPPYVQGDVIGVGYRPRTGSIFFTRNGKKLDDVTHGQKTQNFFPTVGANGPCTVHVNFGQSGFVFIEANVKKWGLAPMTGSLAPPPPYGSEQGSILLEAGREGQPEGGGYNVVPTHGRSRSGNFRLTQLPQSPGPVRSPTEISLAQLAHIPSHEDIGEGTSRSVQGDRGPESPVHPGELVPPQQLLGQGQGQDYGAPPPEYTSPEGSAVGRRSDESQDSDREGGERRPLLSRGEEEGSDEPQVPSYDVAVGIEPEPDSNRRRDREERRDDIQDSTER